MSNTGNMGMGNMGMGNMGMGNMGMGNLGAYGVNGGSALFADRVYLPFVTQVFPNGGRLEKPPVNPPWYPRQNWGAEYYAWLVLTQFIGTEWANLDNKVLEILEGGC